MARYVLVLILALISIGALGQGSTRPSDVEKAYLGAAGGYLKTQNGQGVTVATAMAGLNSGETTLTQVRKAIKDARFVTNMAFQGDYLKSDQLVVPPIFSHIDTIIRKSHTLRDAAYQEFLEYWKDENAAHIQSATKTLKRSEQLAQDAMVKLTAQMKVWHK
jgi:hypothetical protein